MSEPPVIDRVSRLVRGGAIGSSHVRVMADHFQGFVSQETLKCENVPTIAQIVMVDGR